MRYNTWRRPHLGAAPQHLGASPSDPLQLPWLLPRKGPSPPEEVYLSSQAPLLTTDMDGVVSSPGLAAIRRAFCQAMAVLPGRTRKYAVGHRGLGF